jgi:hypothetical protein
MIIDLHYFPCLAYFACISKYDTVSIEAHENYVKQSYRNRCFILTANKVVTLSVPVCKSNRKQTIRDVKIDYQQGWLKDHWRTITSAYGKSPFFEYYSPYFKQVLFKKYKFLFDLNFELLTNCLNLLKLEIKVSQTDTYEKGDICNRDDYRGVIHWKEGDLENIYRPLPYQQNFGSNFVPNLSILDVLFCEGNHSLSIIRRSLIN